MHWHAGNALAQTVFTCLYMFHLSEMDLASIPSTSKTRFEDAGLPVQLVSVVIRAGIMGLLKCCDMSYRELIKGNVHDVSVYSFYFLDLSYIFSAKIGKAKNPIQAYSKVKTLRASLYS